MFAIIRATAPSADAPGRHPRRASNSR
jgi:hypothetical protein